MLPDPPSSLTKKNLMVDFGCSMAVETAQSKYLVCASPSAFCLERMKGIANPLSVIKVFNKDGPVFPFKGFKHKSFIRFYLLMPIKYNKCAVFLFIIKDLKLDSAVKPRNDDYEADMVKACHSTA